MTNNNNQVNWDKIPEDVEAVLSFTNAEDNYYKEVDSKLYVQTFRTNEYRRSGWFSYKDIKNTFGDRFHLRPLPSTQPIPEPPESTQVESSEVEATTTPEFDWSSVEDDVEAVLLSDGECKQWFKTINGTLFVKRLFMEDGYDICYYPTLDNREKQLHAYRGGFGVTKLLRRPPATTTPEDIGLNAAYGIYKKVATEVDKIGRDNKPSISTILQEAQQSILKHHGVTGKVELTVTCKYR